MLPINAFKNKTYKPTLLKWLEFTTDCIYVQSTRFRCWEVCCHINVQSTRFKCWEVCCHITDI